MRRRARLWAEDITGAWAILPTPATPAASDWRSADTVDLDETARALEQLIASGIDGILSLGTLGECAALDFEEKRAFMATMVDVAAGRVPVFGGTTSLSTRETIRQTRVAHDIGVDGVMVGPPMWNKADVAMAVQFYRDLADAVPDVALCAYANPYVFKFDFPPAFWAAVSDIPQMVMAKTAGYASLLADIAASKGRIRFLPIDFAYYGAARLDPERVTAFWSSSAACGPSPVLLLRDFVNKAKETQDWSAAKALSEEMAAATAPIIAYGDWNEFQIHNVALEKIRMDQAGWMRAGPLRPPHHVVPERIRTLAETGGRMWAALESKYAAAAVSQEKL